MDSCVKRCVQTHFLTANMSHSAFAESKPMETFHPDMSTYVKSCTRTRPCKSKWSCHVLVSRRGQTFFVVSLLDCRAQLWWSLVLPSQSVVLDVLVSQRGQSAFFLVVVVSRSSWSVVLVIVISRRGQPFFLDGVYILWWLCTRIY